MIKKIGLLTSGGDAPGMNACVRAVVRSAIHNNMEVVGIRYGYEGMIAGNFIPLTAESVGHIIHKGGTILKTARCPEFHKKEGREKAYNELTRAGVDALIVIGGDGTFAGATIFSNEFDMPVVGIPGTIDNDLFGTDSSIGYDSALNTVVDAVDKIRDTANSHDRMFIVEVMGKDAGFIALRSGIAVGASAILVPETTTYIDHLLAKLDGDYRKNKRSNIVIVAEGDDSGGAFKVAEAVKEKFPHIETRISILGHMQRGGSPSAYDRVLASRLGVGAVNALLDGEQNVMVGVFNNQVGLTRFNQAIKYHKEINKGLLNLAEVLSL